MSLPDRLNSVVTSPDFAAALDGLCDGARLPAADPEVRYFSRIEAFLRNDPAEYMRWLDEVADDRLLRDESRSRYSSIAQHLVRLMGTSGLSAYACAEAMQVCLSDIALLEDLERDEMPQSAIRDLYENLLPQSLELVTRLVGNIASRAKVAQGVHARSSGMAVSLAELDAHLPGLAYAENAGPVLLVLTAGRGTRLRSTIPKGLIPIDGVPMITHVVRMAARSGIDRVVFVLKYRPECQVEYLSKLGCVLTQDRAEGTAHTAFFGLTALRNQSDPVVVSFSDQPFLTPDSFSRLQMAAGAGRADVVMSTFSPAQPETGRVIRDSAGSVLKVTQPRLVSTASAEGDGGLYAMRCDSVLPVLGRLVNDNQRREFNLPDVIAKLNQAGGHVSTVSAPIEEFQSVNTPRDLVLAQLRAAGGDDQAAAFFTRLGADGSSDSEIVATSMDRVASLVGSVLDLHPGRS